MVFPPVLVHPLEFMELLLLTPPVYKTAGENARMSRLRYVVGCKCDQIG
jgi:hypothetical protein